LTGHLIPGFDFGCPLEKALWPLLGRVGATRSGVWPAIVASPQLGGSSFRIHVSSDWCYFFFEPTAYFPHILEILSSLDEVEQQFV